MVRDVDIAWAAGLFEGEGSITRNRRAGSAKNPRVQWSLQLQMTDEDAVRKFHGIVGVGTVREVAKPTKGGKTVWQWGIYNKVDVYDLLNKIGPYLCCRRKHRAEECLSSIGDPYIRRRGPKLGWRNSKWREPEQLPLPMEGL